MLWAKSISLQWLARLIVDPTDGDAAHSTTNAVLRKSTRLLRFDRDGTLSVVIHATYSSSTIRTRVRLVIPVAP